MGTSTVSFLYISLVRESLVHGLRYHRSQRSKKARADTLIDIMPFFIRGEERGSMFYTGKEA
jgi:hypothetical protein